MTTTDQERAPKGQMHAQWEDLEFLDSIIGPAAIFDIGDPDNDRRPAVALIDYEAGTEIPPHSHGCDYLSYVISGEIEITRKTHATGSVRHVKANTAYGPLKVGPEGARVLEVFADRSRLMATFLGDSPLAQQFRDEQERKIAEVLGITDGDVAGG